jgi:hypothetical protein
MSTQPAAIPVVVPAPAANPALVTILVGSGIVAMPADQWRQRPEDAPWPQSTVESVQAADRLVLDYEGNRYGSESFKTWADRVHHAYGRQAQRYPTAARSHVPASAVQIVATYNPLEGEITLLDGADINQLTLWLGADPTASGELRTTRSAAHDQRREIRAALAAGVIGRRTLAAYARRHGHDDLLDGR